MEFPLNKHHFYLIIVSLFCSLLSFPVAAELKIGFVNAIKILETAPQVEDADNRLKKEFAPRQRRLVSAQQEIKTLEERLTKNGNIMSDAEVRRLGRDIRDKKRELKRQQEEYREDLNLRRNEELDKIQKMIIEVIQEFAREAAYDFILSDGVVWAGNHDVTDQVLKRLKQRK